MHFAGVSFGRGGKGGEWGGEEINIGERWCGRGI